MWSDVETDQDFLNFKVLAGLAGQMILDAKGKPLSIGISGGWGVGKSSMVKLIEKEIRATKREDIVFLTFNAWLYQGLDDAKAALMEEISRALMTKAQGDETLFSKAKELAARVNLFRVGKLGLEAALTYATGVPVTPLMRGAEKVFDDLTDGSITSEDVDEAKTFGKEHAEDAKKLLKPKKKPETPPQAIHAFREHFAKLLKDMKVTLVVFVDDLDRCLPPTVIGTLEAMRLFLFMEQTAFVIAADDKMVKEAVRIHFAGARLDDDLVVSYFDKLIQVPLRVPPLGVNEVKAYLALLFVENSGLDEDAKAKVRAGVNNRLTLSWKGEAIDADFVASLIPDCPNPLKAELALGDRLAKQMATSRRIAGNPRLVKRFLNTLSIRRKLAVLQSIKVDDAILAKILLFERCATPASFDFLVQTVTKSTSGIPEGLAGIERHIREGGELPTEGFEAWIADKAFVAEWLKLDPPLGGTNLRGALHVGRESQPFLSADEKISQDARDVTAEALALRVKHQAELKERFARLIPDERKFVMDKLLEAAAPEQSWGTPSILFGLALAADADLDQAKRLVVFLQNIPSTALTPPIVLRISTTDWGKEVIAEWSAREDLPDPLRRHLSRSKGPR